MNPIPLYGVGVGLRPPHTPLFLEAPPKSVDWIEVISENFFPFPDETLANSEPLKNLEKIRSHLPVSLHGVSLSLGGIDPLSPSYLNTLRELVKRLDPWMVSDHLCWTGVDGMHSHDLLPLPYTSESISHVCARILQVQDFLKRPIAIENLSSYVTFQKSEIPEWEFLAEISRKTDCGIVLDVNNIYVSSVNHTFDPLRYLDAIPAERVVEIHLAGHSRRDDCIVDTHDAPICPDVWELYESSLRVLGQRNVMIERDANIPEWTELEQELHQLRGIYETR